MEWRNVSGGKACGVFAHGGKAPQVVRPEPKYVEAEYRQTRPASGCMVMVSYINKLRNSGMELNEAVITGASVRLRAELLSALIGSISLIPFIISSGTGAEMMSSRIY